MVPICWKMGAGGEKEGLVSKGLCPSPHPREDTYPQSLGNLLGQRGTVWAQFSKGLCLAHLHQDSGGQSTLFRGLLSNSHPAGFLEPLPAGATLAHSSPTPCSSKRVATDLRRDCSLDGESETDRGKMERNFRMRERP